MISISANTNRVRGRMTLQEQFRALIEKLGLTQREVGQAMGKDDNWISRKLRGGTRLTIDDASDIAEALGHQFEYAIVRPEQAVDQVERSPEAVAAARDLLSTFDHLSPAEQRMLHSFILAAKRPQEP